VRESARRAASSACFDESRFRKNYHLRHTPWMRVVMHSPTLTSMTAPESHTEPVHGYPWPRSCLGRPRTRVWAAWLRRSAPTELYSATTPSPLPTSHLHPTELKRPQDQLPHRPGWGLAAAGRWRVLTLLWGGCQGVRGPDSHTTFASTCETPREGGEGLRVVEVAMCSRSL
jgi:hypothetical protein